MSLETGSIEFEAAALEHPLLHALIAMQRHANTLAKMYNLEFHPLLPGYDELVAGTAKHYGIDPVSLMFFTENHQPSVEDLTLFIHQWSKTNEQN